LASKRQREAIYEACIRDGHWMDDAPPSTPSSVSFGYVLRCERGCGTYRHLEIHPVTGHVTHSHYDWTDEYLEYRRERGVTRAEARLDALKARGVKRPRLRAVS